MQTPQKTPKKSSLHAFLPPGARWLTGLGLLLGLAFFAASLTPSLVPRTALMQGLLGGALFTVGYMIAVALRALWAWLELPEPHGWGATLAGLAAAALGIALAAFALSQTDEWQNAVRAVMSMPDVETTHNREVLLIALATAAVLGLVILVLRVLVLFVSRRLKRFVPPRVAMLVGLVVGFALFGALVDGVLVRTALTVLDASYAELDRLIEPGTERPAEPWQTGSEASLVGWASLGREGRRFVVNVSRQEAIAEFWSEPAEQPLRVYVGLGSADDYRERAALALDEMIRVGAFDREVLVVAMPTGTGFMDHVAIESLEYLHKGDVATVAAQYSYLQSPFSLIFEPGYGADAARELLHAVYEHWTGLRGGERPRLYLHGLSLGALSSERSLRLHEVIGDPLQGALWAGPPFLSPIHSSLTRERNPGTPEWLPVFGDGSFARFMNQFGMPPAQAPWGALRILYLQHGSDPIVFFDMATLWRRPPWLSGERAPDVADAVRWYPVVTALQVAADMALSNAVPLGFGHQYAPSDYIDGWVSVTEPDVTDADVARLKARFDG